MGVEQASCARELRERMAALTNTRAEDWFLVAKARQGMRVTLAAAAEHLARTEAITQLFTCVTAVNPLVFAGLVPHYADVDASTLSLDPALVRASQATCAVVLQHTFGIVDDFSSRVLRDRAHDAGALLLEDSAHCVGRMAREGSGRPVADVSVHSFGVEKMLFNTYFGGAVWVNPNLADEALGRRLREALASLPGAPKALDKAARAYRNQMRVLTRLPKGASDALRKRWEKNGALEPAVSADERRGVESREASQPSAWMCEQALLALAGLEDNERTRRACVAAYREALGAGGARELQVPAKALEGEVQPLLRFPAFAQGERQALTAAAAVAKLGGYVPSWPRPLLVPGVTDPAPYGLGAGTGAWPACVRLSQAVVALPTDIDPDLVPSVVEAVRGIICDGRA